jgi:hypothetical protein
VKRLTLLFLTLALFTASAPAQVIISEFMADNKHTLADQDNDFSDWIEIYNTQSTNVNLAGWMLTDSAAHQNPWHFPATNLTAKGFMVVFASGKNRAVVGSQLHTDFSLKASGEYLALLRPDGSVATEFTPTFPEQFPDISYGYAQTVVTNILIATGASGRILVPPDGSLGSTWIQPGFSDSNWAVANSGIGFQTVVAGFAVTNFISSVAVNDLSVANSVIANPSQQLAVYSENAPVINYLNTSDGAHYGGDATFPGLTIGVDRDDFVIHATATITIPAPGAWTFGVNSDDGFSLNIGGVTMSTPNPRAPADTLQTFNFPSAGNYSLDFVYYERGGGAEVELFAIQGTAGAWNSSFKLVGDTANGGLTVFSPVAGGGNIYKPFINTDLQSQMLGIDSTVYYRLPFNVATPSTLQSLTLRVRYDDGFIAYLNGQKVAERNAPASPQWNSSATASHPNEQASVFEPINISDRLNLVQPGANVLAIQGLNQSAGDNDFLLGPELVEYKTTNTILGYFATPTPGGYSGTGYFAFVSDTKFSVDRGFYDTPFSLSITTATANATIIYTTNGSTPSLSNGLVYSGPITINGTAVVRAGAFKTGFLPSDVDTQTYIFVNDVIRQSPTGAAPPGWPASWGPNVVDYGMDPDVVNEPAYASAVTNGLKSIPTYSIVTDSSNLFDSATGIYANAAQDGINWERPASVELIYPSGANGFHINAGLRIRGGFSRSTGNPKHAFRFFFRSDYGASKLNYPAFASQNGADTFDGFDLRTFENYSWSFLGDYRFIALRDQFSRDTAYAQGQPTERGDFYHLFINGQYWGLYNTCERPEASYGETYFGGVKEDYDVIKVDTGASYTIFATDGNLGAWMRLWQAATNGFINNADYFKVQGLNPNGTPNPAYENLVDMDNLIVYMLDVFFTGNIDTPITQFAGNNSVNNFYAVRNRTGQFGGFRFFLHDSEHTLLHESSLPSTGELYRDRTGPFPAGDPIAQGPGTAFANSNPQYVFTRLMDNPEFRLRVADHVQKQFFNGGPLTTGACRARFLTRSNEIYNAVVDESARWGDAKSSVPLTRNNEWLTEMNRVYGDYFANRPNIVLTQLQAKALFLTNAIAPTFNQFGGNVTNGFQLTMTTPAGTVYYTRDGSDPRLIGGALSPSAFTYAGPLTLTSSTRFKARTRNGVNWSPLTDATFYIIQNYTNLLITELMYHPPGTTNIDGDQFEFVELKNVSGTTLELSGIHFTGGINYTSPVGTFLPPGQFAVLVRDPSSFTNRYPGVPVFGVYSGKLSNSGKTLSLVHATEEPIFSVNYGTRPPWPAAADGTGFSIVPVNPNLNPDPSNASNWRASSAIGGSPGADDPASNILPIFVNEALTHTDLPQVDSVELYNPNSTNVDISNWYLTDDRTTPQKFRIPNPTSIPAHGYIVFTETNWNANPNSSNSFRLNSHGEEIYLYSADTNGSLTGFSDGFAFGAARNGVSFGRYIISTGEAQYPAQIANTPGATNAGPRVGPVVINEINYHPPLGGDEFIELLNITNVPVPLYDPAFPTNTWKLNGVGYNFPSNTTLAANGLMLLIAGDPATFRAKYAVPGSVPILGPYPGALQGNGETLSLQFPDQPDFDTNTGTFFIPYIDMDVVHYDDKSPWPTNADGHGSSLERLSASAYGNDPINWRASPGAPSPGFDNFSGHPPTVYAGPDQAFAISNVPYALVLSGSATPGSSTTLTLQWKQLSGPAPVWFNNPALSNAIVTLPGAGTYNLRLTADNGFSQASDDVTFIIQRPPSTTPTNFVAFGSVWKYLDNGSDQGTAWIVPAFPDGSWLSGPAPLGYGDANGVLPATLNSYGPDPNNKYVTTYYRRAFTVANPAVVSNLVASVQRDDGLIVYLNGTPIITNNMPTPFNYLTYASTVIGGSDETNIYPQAVPASLLVGGANVLASEVHQANATSSDLFFDLQLSGTVVAANQAPVVSAGPDQSIALPMTCTFAGSASDDGLPSPPGLLSITWSKLSGPGAVTFSNSNAPVTTATFSASGIYQLRITGNDGAIIQTDDVTITVTNPPPPQISSTDLIGANPRSFRLTFTALGGLPYTVRYRDSLTTGSWQFLTNIPAAPATQLIQILDPLNFTAKTRFYRVSTP